MLELKSVFASYYYFAFIAMLLYVGFSECDFFLSVLCLRCNALLYWFSAHSKKQTNLVILKLEHDLKNHSKFNTCDLQSCKHPFFML